MKRENSRRLKSPTDFNFQKIYIRTDGWRGYEQPKYAVAGANDTGMFEDSPCPSSVCNAELKAVKKALKGIPVRSMVCQSSNVFCAHRYLVVPPAYVDQAKEIVRNYIKENETRLLYEA